MKTLVVCTLMTGMMLVGMQAFAEDVQADHTTKSEMMKDCMARMNAKNDGSTKHQMKAACKTEMREAMNGNGTDHENADHDNGRHDDINKDDSTTHDGMDRKPQ